MEANGVKMGPRQMSFAAAVANQGNQSRVYGVRDGVPALQPRFQPIPLSNRHYSQVDGKPAVYFSTTEFEAGVSLFKHSLVAKFTVGRPPIAEIRRIFKENWLIKGRATISDIWDGRHLMIILDSEEDARIALTSPIRKVGHAMFRLFRYTPDYNPRHESTSTTKWVRLPGLHPGFFSRNYVAGIVNSFGDFLEVDNYTKACASLKYARACVEVDVAKPIPEEVTIVLSDGRKFCQKVEVEGNMAYCAFCKIHGHSLMDCRKKRKEPEGRKAHDASNNQASDKEKDVVPKAMPIAIQGDGKDNGKTSDANEPHEGWTEVKTKKKNKKVNFTSIPKERKDNEAKVLVPLDNDDVLKSGNNTNENNEDEDSLERELLPDLHNDDDKSKEVVDAMSLVVYTGDVAGGSAHGEMREQDRGQSAEVVIATNVSPSTDSFEDHVIHTREDGSIYCDTLGGKLFQDNEELVKFAKSNGYVIKDVPITTLEGFGKVYEDREVLRNSDNESCGQVDQVDSSQMPIISSQQRTRHRKKKGSRSSTRSCPKKKDSDFIWP